MATVTVESLLRNTNFHFLPSPCTLKSWAGKIEREFDRDDPDAEAILREVFVAHDKASEDWVDVEIWISWCLEKTLPRHSDTSVNRTRGVKIYDWI